MDYRLRRVAKDPSELFFLEGMMAEDEEVQRLPFDRVLGRSRNAFEGVRWG
jgi:hypothetical protein